MTINLPPTVENSIRHAVLSGQFASMDEAMTEAAELLLERLQSRPAYRKAEAAASPAAPASEATAQPQGKPIWEEVEELRASVPPEEFLKLPKDGAEQLDHYLYGSPKRPIS